MKNIFNKKTYLKFSKIIAVSIFFIFSSLTVSAQSSSGGGYTLQGGTVSISDGFSSGGSYTIGASSRSISGQSSGGGFVIQGGAGSSDSSSDTFNSTTGKRNDDTAIVSIDVQKKTDSEFEIKIITNKDTITKLAFIDPSTNELVVVSSNTIGSIHYFNIENLNTNLQYNFIFEATDDKTSAKETYQFKIEEEDFNLIPVYIDSTTPVFEPVFTPVEFSDTDIPTYLENENLLDSFEEYNNKNESESEDSDLFISDGDLDSSNKIPMIITAFMLLLVLIMLIILRRRKESKEFIIESGMI